MSERILHCWEDGPRVEDGTGTTCMLPDGHAGPHEWSRDDGIAVTFEKAIAEEFEPETDEENE